MIEATEESKKILAKKNYEYYFLNKTVLLKIAFFLKKK